MLNTSKLFSAQKLRDRLPVAPVTWPRGWGWIALAALGAVLAGCDAQKLQSPTQQADAQVQKKIHDAFAQGTAAGAQTTSANLLKDAAALGGASNVNQALAQGMLADAEMAQAVDRLLQINNDEAQIARLVDQMGQICAQADKSVQRARLLRQSNDPGTEPSKSLVDTINQQRQALQAKVQEKNAQAQRLSADIQQRTQKIDALKKQHSQAQQAQGAMEEIAAKTKGAEGVELYAKANEVRVRVGTTAAELEAAAADLIPVQQELARVQVQQAVFERGIQDLNQHLKLMQEQWQALQQQQIHDCEEQAQAEAARLASKTGEVAVKLPWSKWIWRNLPEKAAAKPVESESKAPVQLLQELVQKVQTQRQEAIKLMESASEHYQNAAAAAHKVFGEMNAKINLPEMRQSDLSKTLKAMQELVNQSAYWEQQGTAQVWLGNLYATQALELHDRLHLAEVAKTILAQANVEVPAPLATGTMPQDLEATLKNANAAYSAAGKTLDQITGTSTSQAVKNGGRFAKVMSLLGQFVVNNDPKYYNQAREVASSDSINPIELPPSIAPSSESPEPTTNP